MSGPFLYCILFFISAENDSIELIWQGWLDVHHSAALQLLNRVLEGH